MTCCKACPHPGPLPRGITNLGHLEDGATPQMQTRLQSQPYEDSWQMFQLTFSAIIIRSEKHKKQEYTPLGSIFDLFLLLV